MRHLALSLFCLLAAGCDAYYTDPKLCPEIPAGGCPTGRGGTCDDPACNALYDCVDGAWKKAQTCNDSAGGGNAGGSGGTPLPTTGSGGAGGGCAPMSGGAAGSGGGCTPVMIDHTGEQAGCTPDLQLPDCPAAAAEPCAEAACLTGCDGFFLCTADGWVEVAHCDTMTCAFVPGSP